MRVHGGWQERLRRARQLYAERFEDKPTFRKLAAEAEKLVGPEAGTSYATVHRHFQDPGQTPRPELLRGLAHALDVREEWLFRGEGEPTREQEERARLAAEAAGALRRAVSEPLALSDAGEALLVKAMERWTSLPDYVFSDSGAPEPGEAAEGVADIIRVVLQRLPRTMWSEDDWHDFSVALLSALMFGVKDEGGGTPKAAVLHNLEEFAALGLPEGKVTRREDDGEDE